ncbi:MAG: hypothetical protein SAMD01599839_12480 [Rectinema sp.]
MRIDLPYRNGKIGLDLPDSTEVIEPNNKETDDSPRDLVRQALEKPLDSPDLDRFFVGAVHPLVIVNDGTRPTPTSVVLDVIGDGLEACGARFIVATGAHRAPTEDEYRFIFGANYGRFREKTEAHMTRGGESRSSSAERRGPVRLYGSTGESWMRTESWSSARWNRTISPDIPEEERLFFRESPAMRRSRRTINWRFSPKPILSLSTKIRCTAIWKTR